MHFSLGSWIIHVISIFTRFNLRFHYFIRACIYEIIIIFFA